MHRERWLCSEDAHRASAGPLGVGPRQDCARPITGDEMPEPE